MTGWILSVVFLPLEEPKPESVFIWNGTEIRFAIGFDNCFAKSASVACAPPVEVTSAAKRPKQREIGPNEKMENLDCVI